MSETFPISEDTWQNYRQQLYFFILKQVKDHSTAEDITQDVLLRVYTHLETLNCREKFLPWFYRIARNAIADYYRHSRTELLIPEALALASSEDSETPTPSVYEQVAPCLLPLIQKLPTKYKEAILLAEIENRSQQELAEISGLSLAGAKSRVQRGRRLLKALLFQSCRLPLNQAGRLLDTETALECN